MEIDWKKIMNKKLNGKFPFNDNLYLYMKINYSK